MQRSWIIGVTATFMLTACAHSPKWQDVDNDQPLHPAAPKATLSFIPMPGSMLQRRLGKPDFVHLEKDSQIWRYDLPGCRVMFFLYPSTDDNRLSVHTFRSLPDGVPDKLSPTCRKVIHARMSAAD